MNPPNAANYAPAATNTTTPATAVAASAATYRFPASMAATAATPLSMASDVMQRTPASAPLQVSTRFLATEGGRIAFDDSGGETARPLVIALPGMGDLRGQYRYLRAALIHAGFRVVTMDVRGQGESSVDWPDYSAHAAGRDILALITHLGCPSATVIGNSFAAGAALWAARLAPQRIDRAVLIGPILRDLPVPPWVRLALRIGFAGPWRNRFWLAYWDSLFTSRKPPDHAHYRAALSRNLREPGRFAALGTMVGLSKRDTESIIDATGLPCLVVMGTSDPDFPDAAAEARLLGERLGAEVLLVDRAGHYPHVEMPEVTASGILDFLGEHQ